MTPMLKRTLQTIGAVALFCVALPLLILLSMANNVIALAMVLLFAASALHYIYRGICYLFRNFRWK